MAKSESMSVSEGEVLEKGSNSKSRELKKELQRLVLEIIDSVIEDDDVDNESDNNNDNNDDNNNGVFLGTIDKAIQALTTLKELKLKKKKHSISSRIDQSIVPEEFRCPISKEIMKDPVILTTGQTYDRPFIQNWFKAGNRICPQTQQVLARVELTPNHLVRELITQWCKDHGTELPPPPLQDTNDGLITDADRNRLSSLLEKLSSSLSDQKEAAKEIRMLTRRMPSFRSFFGESPNAIPQLLDPLANAETFENNPDLQEDLITTILNLSIHDNNKKLIAEYPQVIPLLVESLKCGTMETRANAAAALFSLSALDDNKLLIGELGALKPLLDLLKQGHQSAMKDVASAIFNLCKKRENRGKAVRAGAVKVILDKIKERVYVSELLAILALLSTHHTAINELEALNSVECLLSIIRESNCEPDRENCVVILHDLCEYNRFALKDVRADERENKTLSKLAENGTSRAQRKANGILDRLRSSRRINYTHTA